MCECLTETYIFLKCYELRGCHMIYICTSIPAPHPTSTGIYQNHMKATPLVFPSTARVCNPFEYMRIKRW